MVYCAYVKKNAFCKSELTEYVNRAIWLDYKYKDKNAMYIENVLELVGSPAVLCK